MFFGKKKLKDKKIIDYVLEDIPFGLENTFTMLRDNNIAENSMRATILGNEKAAIENAAITKAIKVALFLSILAGVAEAEKINIPLAYWMYHTAMIEDAWGVIDGVRFGEANDIAIKAVVKRKFNDLSDFHRRLLLGFIEPIVPMIEDLEHVKILIHLAEKTAVKTG